MRFEILTKGRVDPPTTETLDLAVESLMGALVELDVDDPAVSGTLSTATVEVEMVVDAPGPAEAVAVGAEYVTKALIKTFGQLPAPVADVFPEWTARREDDALTPA